jgi:spore germination protein YaaH
MFSTPRNYFPWLLATFSLSVFFLQPLVSSAATRTLSLGLSGDDVVTLQTTLISKGYLSGNATGYFGPLTEKAVKKFQCDQNIVCTGTSANGFGVVSGKTATALAGLPISASTGGAITGSSLTGPWKGAFEYSGWVPGWRAASGTLDVLPHIKQLTSVMPFGYKVGSDGHLIDDAKISQDPWPAFLAEARRNKVRIVPTVVWGSGPAIHAVLSDTKKRIALEDEIVALVKNNNFDGIDIDFEAKQEKTRDYFSTFLKGLYQRMGKKLVYCTIEARMPLIDRYLPGETIPPDATDFANDYNAMNKYCDRVEIMAYDQGTVDRRLNIARQAPYAPVADPGWVEDLITLAAQNIAKNKLILGVPAYGYEYLVTPVSGSYRYKVLWAFNPDYAMKVATKLGITPSRTSANELGFTYDPKVLAAVAPTGNDSAQTQQTEPTITTVQNASSLLGGTQPFNYMTWSDAVAIKDKIDMAKRLGLRGVAVFSMGGAEDQAMWNILK